MTYYLLINEDPVEIGEVSFDKFYAYDGWHHINKIVNKIVDKPYVIYLAELIYKNINRCK